MQQETLMASLGTGVSDEQSLGSHNCIPAAREGLGEYLAFVASPLGGGGQGGRATSEYVRVWREGGGEGSGELGAEPMT